MKPITGITINHLPFQLEKRIGVLLFAEFPSTTIFADENGMPIVKEWIDCNDDLERYFVYKVSKQHLKAFIEGKLSHFELYLYAENHIGIIVDEKEEKNQLITVIASAAVPNDYYPSVDYFFKKENGVETKAIIDFFKLDEIQGEPPTKTEGYVRKLSTYEYKEYKPAIAQEPEMPYGEDGFSKITFFPVQGKFRAIDCETGAFVLMSITEKRFSGKFDTNLIKDGIHQLTFTQSYRIIIQRKETEEGELKIQDTIMTVNELE